MTRNKIALLFYLIFLIYSQQTKAQEFAEVFIIVKHQKSNKTIEDAEVFIYPIERTFTTNKKGVAQVGLPYALYRFEISTPLTEKIVREVEIVADTTLRFMIEGDYMLLDDIEIAEHPLDERVGKNVMSVERLDVKQVDRIPAIAGEKDFIKAAAYLPGIQTGSEGSSDLLVRGGTPDQNLYLLDGARIYHSNHLYGFLSSFNPLMVSSVDIYKGGFPPRFGDKLSAIIDAQTSEPLYNAFKGEANVGIISSSLKLNVPIISDKLNLMVGGRRSYYDAFVKLFANNDSQELYNFHDLNVKLSGKINEANEISFSAYMDRDLYHEFDNDKELSQLYSLKRKWSNQIYNLRWRGKTGVIDNELNMYFSGFRTSISEENRYEDEFYKTVFSSYIKDFTFRYKAATKFNEFVEPYLGVEASRLEVLGAEVEYEDQDTSLLRSSLPQQVLTEYNLFGGVNFNIEDNRWKANIGARVSSTRSNASSNTIFEPRAAVTYNPDQNRSLKFSYSKMSQSIHMLTNPGLGMPIDLYVPWRQEFTPETSHQFAMGYIQNFNWLNEKWDFNIEAYYKSLHNILEYKDGYSSHVFTSPISQGNSLEDIITTGDGISYGSEFFLSKNTGNLKGFLSYTLSQTRHQFGDLNNGEYFPARHDIRHNLAVSATYQLSKKWRFNASWQYKTGQAITLPLQTYPAPRFSLVDGNIRPYDPVLTVLYEQSERNEYRMKSFHVLNVSVQKQFDWKKVNGTFEFGFYNAYNRKNPYYYHIHQGLKNFEKSHNEYDVKTSLRSVSIFPIVPSLSLTIGF